ncbi:hypothetical protein [Burkholderia multivorans]|uniref:hypothetical protein n=1 Tax=Burkholderia multivorans TaxID=87883 RepID=UPI0012FD1E1F|nr:hypothetical protein [Burkholderia multivorans]
MLVRTLARRSVRVVLAHISLGSPEPFRRPVRRSALFIPWADLVPQSTYFAIVNQGSSMKKLIASLCAALALAGCSDSHLKIKLTNNCQRRLKTDPFVGARAEVNLTPWG